MDAPPRGLLRMLAALPRVTPAGGSVLLVIAVLLALAVALAGHDPERLAPVNYLYALVALLVGALLVSPALARFNLSRIRVRRELPGQVFAGEPFSVTLVLTLRGRLARLGVRVADSLPVPRGWPPYQAYAIALSRRRALRLTYTTRGLPRGRLRLTTATLATRFPFGLLELRRVCPAVSELLVYPPVGRLGQPLKQALGPDPLAGRDRRRHRGGGDDYAGVREHRSGDAMRHIHWPQTARQRQLMIREREREEFAPLLVLVDTCATDAGRRAVEIALSLAATLITDAVEQGRRVGLALFAPAPVVRPPGAGARQRLALLESVAVAEPGGPPLEALAAQLPAQRMRETQAIALLLRSPRRYVLGPLRRAFRNFQVLNVRRPDLRDWFFLPQWSAVEFFDEFASLVGRASHPPSGGPPRHAKRTPPGSGVTPCDPENRD